MRTVLLLILISFLPLAVIAQQKTSDELKEIFNDGEFFLAQEAYVDALYDYNDLYNNGYQGNANINYKIGICYLNIPGQKEKSISYFLQAIKDVSKKYRESTLKQESAPLDAWLFLGNAYRVNNQLNEAINAYTRYKELSITAEEIAYADQQILACQTARRFIENGRNIRLVNLGDSINGPSSNFKGVISGNGKVLLYMNELPFYNAVYFSTFNGEGWSSPINITPQLQSDGDQYVTSVSYEGNILLLTREDPFNSDIYISYFRNGKWTRSVPVAGEDINTKFWESHASISKDEKTIYFTSNRKGGAGNMDIYRAAFRNGVAEKPVNLGSVINTPLNEDTPFISDNDSMLFFSSQGHENMGGYDIFVSVLDAEGNWSKPQNIGYPLNTTDDDLFYYPWRNNQAGIIARITDNGFGKEDIYAIQEANKKDFNNILAELHMPAVPPPAKPTEPAKPSTTPGTPAEVVEPHEQEPAVTPVKVEEPSKPEKIAPFEITLDPVYFAFDNFNLTDGGKLQMQKIRDYLTEYSVARVRLIGHADAKGPAQYNLILSEKRAVAAKSYLVSLGIDGSRIETLGLGEKNFAAINANADGSDNPEGRRLNRRVEYEIIGPENSPIIIHISPVPENLKYRP